MEDKMTDEAIDAMLKEKLAHPYFKKMEKATTKDLASLAAFVEVLIFQLNILLKKYPNFKYTLNIKGEDFRKNIIIDYNKGACN